MASSSRGLPGFLRRSLRADYSEDSADEADQELEESSPPLSSSASPPTEPEKMNELQQPGLSTSTDNQNQEPISDNGDSTGPQLPAAMPLTEQPRRLSSEPLPTLKSEEGQRSSTTASQQESPQDSQSTPRPKSYREKQFENIFSANVVSMPDLKTVAWNGIPSQHRPQSWKILLGYLPTNASRREFTLQKKRAEYLDAVAQHYDIDDNSRTMQEQEVLRQVLVDVPRTAPTVQLFRDERIKSLLTRILYIWAMRHPASSYVQGINDLAMPLIVTYLSTSAVDSGENNTDDEGKPPVDNGNSKVDYDAVLEGRIMETVSDEQLQQVEADCYWSLTNLLAGIQDHYTSDQPGVQRMVLRLEELVNRIDSGLCTHLRDTGIEFMQFAFKWMNCLLLREFNLKCVIRLWDTYISEKDGFEDFHVYVCAAFLCQFSSRLQAMPFDELFGFFQSMPTGEWGDTEVEMLLSQAFVLSTLFGGSDAHLSANPSQS